MSFEDVNTVLQAVITSRRGVSAAAMKIVLAVIAQHTSAKRGDHRAFPGLKRLSKMSGLSVSQVSAAVDALVEFGAFKEYKQGGGRKKSNYVINIAKLSNLGIDWLKGQGSDTEPTVQIPNPAFGYLFRPAYIQPLYGARTKTSWYGAFYAVVRPFYPVLKMLFPNYVTTTECVGHAMLSVTKRGFPKPILENRDINVMCAKDSK
jgi:hypothetical protein